MKRKFDDAFSRLYDDYAFEHDNYPDSLYEGSIIRKIQKSIESADPNHNLRSDAKYFLLVNFHHLVTRPLLDRDRFFDRSYGIELDRLVETIQSDITDIITKAPASNNEDKISGHQIMKAIDNQWRYLKSTKLEIWG